MNSVNSVKAHKDYNSYNVAVCSMNEQKPRCQEELLCAGCIVVLATLVDWKAAFPRQCPTLGF